MFLIIHVVKEIMIHCFSQTFYLPNFSYDKTKKYSQKKFSLEKNRGILEKFITLIQKLNSSKFHPSFTDTLAISPENEAQNIVKPSNFWENINLYENLRLSSIHHLFKDYVWIRWVMVIFTRDENYFLLLKFINQKLK